MELNRFESFISETIKWETGGDRTGAYTNDPKDSGGETKWGISKKFNPEVDIKELTYKGAVDIYREKYYNPYYDLVMSENIAFKVYDMGVLCGPITAVRKLQKTIGIKTNITLKEDGILGPITLTALHMAVALKGEEEIYKALVTQFKNRFLWIVVRKPWNKKWLQGWYNRADFQFKLFAEIKK